MCFADPLTGAEDEALDEALDVGLDVVSMALTSR